MPRKKRTYPDNALALTQVVVAEKIKYLSVSNTLTVAQSLAGSHKPLVVGSFLTLTQSASIVPIHEEDLSSSLVLTQAATAGGTLYHAASNALGLTQALGKSNIQAGVASNALTVTQLVAVAQPLSNVGSNTLSLTQAVSVGKVINATAVNYVSLGQLATRLAGGSTQTASNHISLFQSATVGTTLNQPYNNLHLIGVAIGIVTHPVSNALTLTQTLDPDFVRARTLSDALILVQAAHAFLESDTLTEESQWLETPTLVSRATTRFTYPYASPVQTLDLRNPDFNNAALVSNNRINVKSRGGTLHVFRDDNWPSAERLKMTFSYLTVEQRVALLKFLEDSLGQEVGLLDHESRQWRGIILTPAAQITEAKIGGPLEAGHSASLEFQGELV